MAEDMVKPCDTWNAVLYDASRYVNDVSPLKRRQGLTIQLADKIITAAREGHGLAEALEVFDSESIPIVPERKWL